MTKLNPLQAITFIMPAYNAQTTIKSSVSSIFKRNFSRGDELIIVNDHSTDNTAQVLKELKKSHPEIAIVNHPFNKGGGAARNTAIEKAHHSLIFCLDSDNILVPGSVPRLNAYLSKTKSDVATFGTVKYFDTTPSRPTHQWKYKSNSTSLQGMLSSHKVPGSSGNYLFTKDSWLKAGRYPEFAGAFDTWGFGFRQLASGSKMSSMPGSFYLHRYGHESYWVRESQNGMISLKALQLLLPYLDLLNPDDVNYMMDEKTRGSWFDDLEKRPIRLKSADYKRPMRWRIPGVSK